MARNTSQEVPRPITEAVRIEKDEEPRKFKSVDLEELSTHPDLQGRVKEHPVVKSEENGRVYVTREEELEYSYTRLLLIYKCTDDCLTILTKAHIKEMLRFTELAVDDPAWAESCARIPDEPFKDGVDCSDSAYYNMTKYLGNSLDYMTDEQIQDELERIIK